MDHEQPGAQRRCPWQRLPGTGGYHSALRTPFVAHTRFDLAELERSISAAGFEVAVAERLPGLFPLGYVVAHSETP